MRRLSRWFLIAQTRITKFINKTKKKKLQIADPVKYSSHSSGIEFWKGNKQELQEQVLPKSFLNL